MQFICYMFQAPSTAAESIQIGYTWDGCQRWERCIYKLLNLARLNPIQTNKPLSLLSADITTGDVNTTSVWGNLVLFYKVCISFGFMIVHCKNKQIKLPHFSQVDQNLEYGILNLVMPRRFLHVSFLQSHFVHNKFIIFPARILLPKLK